MIEIMIEIFTSRLFLICFFTMFGFCVIAGWSMMVLCSRISREEDKVKGRLFDEKF